MKQILYFVIVTIGLNTCQAQSKKDLTQTALKIFDVVKNIDTVDIKEFKQLFVSSKDLDIILANKKLYKYEDTPDEKIRDGMVKYEKIAIPKKRERLKEEKENLPRELRDSWDEMEFVEFRVASVLDYKLFVGGIFVNINNEMFVIKLIALPINKKLSLLKLFWYRRDYGVETGKGHIFKRLSPNFPEVKNPKGISSLFFEAFKLKGLEAAQLAVAPFLENVYPRPNNDLEYFCKHVGSYKGYKLQNKKKLKDLKLGLIKEKVAVQYDYLVEFEKMSGVISLIFTKQYKKWVLFNYTLSCDYDKFKEVEKANKKTAEEE